MYEMPLRYLPSTINSYSRNISVHCYSAGLLNTFLFPCVFVSNLGWYEQRQFHAGTHKWKCHRFQRCWACYLLPNSRNVTHSTFFQLHMHQNNWFNLSENIWAQYYSMQPYNKSKHSLFSTQRAVCVLSTLRDILCSWDFSGIKILLWKSTCLCKNT